LKGRETEISQSIGRVTDRRLEKDLLTLSKNDEDEGFVD
jgi:hypothetical protein